jgi:hypothetical protein
VELRLRELAAASRAGAKPTSIADELAAELTSVQVELEVVAPNLARAKSDEQYRAISDQFDQLKAREMSLQIELAKANAERSSANIEIDVKAIVSGLERLLAAAGNETELKIATNAIRTANAKLFLSFKPVAVKNRTLNKITGGVVTLGDANPPVEVYGGPTGRNQVKLQTGDRNTVDHHPDRPID